MNVFIMSDLEGIACVTDAEYMNKGTEKYAQACRDLEKSINIAIEASIKSGAEHVYYFDGHTGGGNVDHTKIDSRGEKCDLNSWQQLMREGKIDCLIEIGSHARAGTLNGFLDHTISSTEWFCNKVNGVEMSELSMHAIVCAKYGVPIIACFGDETACAQAREYIPDIYVGAVKKASCRNLAVEYENADQIIYDTVQEALDNYKNVSIVKFQEPLTVELTYYRSDMCDAAYARADENVERVDARTLRRVVAELKSYNQLKF